MPNNAFNAFADLLTKNMNSATHHVVPGTTNVSADTVRLKALTGLHARLHIYDDLHDRENASTPESRQVIKDTYYNTLMGRADPTSPSREAVDAAMKANIAAVEKERDDALRRAREANTRLYLLTSRRRERLSATWEHLPDPSVDGVVPPVPPKERVLANAFARRATDARRMGFRQST